ncbi:hypothetical protein CDL15_Pgr009955 [Punica granatum]|nr:hypothetical protein CDL15_Pgr009955 [Punica granatum]
MSTRHVNMASLAQTDMGMGLDWTVTAMEIFSAFQFSNGKCNQCLACSAPLRSSVVTFPYKAMKSRFCPV